MEYNIIHQIQQYLFEQKRLKCISEINKLFIYCIRQIQFVHYIIMKPHALRKLLTNPPLQNSLYQETTQPGNYLSLNKYNRQFMTKNNRQIKNRQLYSLQSNHISQSPYLQRMNNIRNANKKKEQNNFKSTQQQETVKDLIKETETKRRKNQTPLVIFKKTKQEVQRLNQINHFRSLSNNSHYHLNKQKTGSSGHNNIATFKLPKIDHEEPIHIQKQSVQSATLQFHSNKKNKIQLAPLNSIKNKNTFKFCTKTKAGTNGKQQKINQDIAFIEEKLLFGLKCYCVCDGHGLNGHLVSAFIKMHFVKNLTTALKKHNNSSTSGQHPSNQKMQQLIYNTLIKTNQMLLDSDINTELSGSTVVCVFVYKGEIFCFNVGDSRAILCQKYETNISTPQNSKKNGFQLKQQDNLLSSNQGKYKSQMLNSKNFKQIVSTRVNQNHQFNLSQSRKLERYQWKFKELSIDQKPERKDQHQRIIRNGGRIQCNKTQRGQQIGPLRVWIKDIQMPGLAMTRSFGDKAGVRAGTNGEPEIIQHQILAQDKFIIIASDGVWEYLENQQVMNIMIPFYQNGNLEGGAQKIVKISTDIWSKISLSRDDITVIVVSIS